MRHEDYTYGVNGFVGHLAEPDQGSEYGVIVVMGGEQSLLPGIKSAERFADYGITGLAVSLFGADGLPEGPDRIPVDMFEPAVDVLRQKGLGISALWDSPWDQSLPYWQLSISADLRMSFWYLRHMCRLRVQAKTERR